MGTLSGLLAPGLLEATWMLLSPRLPVEQQRGSWERCSGGIVSEAPADLSEGLVGLEGSGSQGTAIDHEGHTAPCWCGGVLPVP